MSDPVRDPRIKMQSATLPLVEGTVHLELPPALSRKSYNRLASWLDLMKSVAEDFIEAEESAAEQSGTDEGGKSP